ncbi:hypothetical protein D3C76_1523600 [compost metagenome]
MLAMPKDHGDPRLAVGFELAVGQAQFVEQVEIEGVALGNPIQADQQDMTALFTAHTTAVELFHGAFPRAGRGVGPTVSGCRVNRFSAIARWAGPLKNRRWHDYPQSL